MPHNFRAGAYTLAAAIAISAARYQTSLVPASSARKAALSYSLNGGNAQRAAIAIALNTEGQPPWL